MKIKIGGNDNFMQFPMQEYHYRLSDFLYKTPVTIQIQWPCPLEKLLLVHDCVSQRTDDISLFIPYFPYARQDRITKQENFYGESLSVRAYANVINSLKFKRVIIYDPHSDVTPALIHNCEIKSQNWLVRQVLYTEKQYPVFDYIISPDIGAYKKANKVGELLNKPVVCCLKHRDTQTGKLSGFELLGDVSGDVLIVDDIGDGCGTFLGIYELLKDRTNSVSLYITHAGFTKGIDILKPFRRVYCTNSIKTNFDFTGTNIVQIDIFK